MGSNSNFSESQVFKLVQGIVNHAIDGVGPLCSAEELARQYMDDTSYSSIRQRIDAMVRWETSKSATNGFVAGMGGAITLPVSVPWAVYSSWVIQARLIAAIAEISGRSTKDDRVRTFVLLMLLGDAAKEVLRDFGIVFGRKLTTELIRKLPGRLLTEINKKIGFRLLAKTGEKSLLQLSKIVPLIGGLVSATIEGTSTYSVGRGAVTVFAQAT